MRILGIDPGSRIAGYGVIETDHDRITLIDHGCLKMNEKSPLAERLMQLNVGLERIFKAHVPELAIIERVFVGRNAASALHLGHSRGVCFLQAAMHKAAVVEYATREVKKGITGKGSSDKWTVRLRLQLLLGCRLEEELDATDALALAVYHAQALWIASRIQLAR